MKIGDSIEKLKIKPSLQKKLKKLGVKKIADLLFHFPHRYDDFSKIAFIKNIKLNENFCLQGKVLEIETRRTFRRNMHLTEAILEDKTGAIRVVWFNQPYINKYLKKGDNVYLTGRVVLGREGVYLASPAFEKVSKNQPLHTGRLVPVYPETAGLTSRWLRREIETLLQKFAGKFPETLPEEIIKKEALMPFSQALSQIHFPKTLALAEKAKARFQFEELFLIQLYVLKEKMKLLQEKAAAIPLGLNLIKKLIASLPFRLTDAQKRSAWQILKDLEKPRPMNRLLEGDVGSGKTVVAAIAVLNTTKAGWQAAFMVPTEILAKQHFQEVSKLLRDFNLNIGLLTGREDKLISKKLKNQVIEISRQKLLEKTRGKINPHTKEVEVGIDILIGTHALIQDKVKFGRLALVVLDEQHRFGVEQRARLCQGYGGQAKPIPHLLSMTATPIPRTLALTIYGDLDLSLIDELPKGRKEIITKIVAPEERPEIYRFVEQEIKKGRQAFVICPRIEPANNEQRAINNEEKTKNNSNILSWAEVKAVKEEYEKLSKEIFPRLRIGILHGKMALKEKQGTMQDFKNKKIDILVSTSVVEVGIDIPNASVMLIEGAERFGLAQLHQFRGRVGRSHYQSYCFLLTDSPSANTRKRLKALLTAKNSFALAEKDLQIRGPGDFLGTRQWGLPDLAMSGLSSIVLVNKTRMLAREILDKSPSLEHYTQLKQRLEVFQEKVHLE